MDFRDVTLQAIVDFNTQLDAALDGLTPEQWRLEPYAIGRATRGQSMVLRYRQTDANAGHLRARCIWHQACSAGGGGISNGYEVVQLK